MSANNFGPAWGKIVALGVGVTFLLVLIALAIGILICWFLMTCFQRIPPQHRKQQPALVWLLLIPCFNLVWNFFVYPKLAESFKAHFDAAGPTDVGDCGQPLAMWYCILSVAGVGIALFAMIPIIGMFFRV